MGNGNRIPYNGKIGGGMKHTGMRGFLEKKVPKTIIELRSYKIPVTKIPVGALRVATGIINSRYFWDFSYADAIDLLRVRLQSG